MYDENIFCLDGIWKIFPDPDETGEKRGFYKPEFDDSRWYDIEVPSHWQDKIADLRNYAGAVWYRKRFKYERKQKNGSVWLVFKGVFYKAEVWLNGKKLGKNEGYFFPFKFDITPLLSEEENVLAVKVTSRNEKDLNKKTQVGGVFYHWDCRNPHFNPGGIWNSVLIYETGPACIERVKIISNILSKKLAKIKVILWIFSKEDTNAKIVLRIKPKNFKGKEILVEFEERFKIGCNVIHNEIKIENARLWWTWDLGKPNLYILEATVMIDDEISDVKREVFGIKEVKIVWKRNKFEFYLNGKRLFLRGTNYAPTDQRLARVTIDRIKEDVKLMREANINIVRVHAHVGRPELHDILSEEGILVWQDMPLIWFYDKKVKKVAIENAKKLVHMLENKACLAFFNCHNEPCKFPFKKDLLKSGLIFFTAILFSMFFGFIGHKFKTKLVSIPFLDRIMSILTTPLIPDCFFLTFGFFLSLLLIFIFIFPMIAYTADPWLGIISSFILAILFPLDVWTIAILLFILTDDVFSFLLFNSNKRKIAKAVLETIKKEDVNQHPVILASGIPGYFFNGTDTHIYSGWYVGWIIPFKRFRGYRQLYLLKPWKRMLRFVTEFGAQAFPCKESLLKILPEKLRQKILTKPWKEVYKEIAKYLKLHHQYQPRFMRFWINPLKFDSLDDFIKATQEYQAELIKFYIEFLRRHRFNPTGGVLQFMLTDCAPVITWAVLDYWRKPKQGYFAMKLAFEPVYAFADWPRPRYKIGESYRGNVYVVNDLHEKIHAEVIVEKISTRGKEEIFRKNLELPKDSLLRIGKITFKLTKDSVGFQIVLRYKNKEIINRYELKLEAD